MWIPEDIITKLEDQWPDARLSVTNHRRLDAVDEDRDVDTRLLSSPLLYSLRFTIYYFGDRSEFQKLKDILLKSTRLRVLHLKICEGLQIHSSGYGPPQELNLALLPSDRLAPLHELMVSDWPPYYFSPGHCEIWSECMDWTELKSLDLGSGCPGDFFNRFLGRVPNLKSLRLGFDDVNPWPYELLPCGEPDSVRGFIESIDDLHELFITNQIEDPEVLFPAIVKHRGSLQTLGFHTPPDTSYYKRDAPGVWTTEQLTQLREQFTKLSRLEIDLDLEDSKLVREILPSAISIKTCN
jgi:hypothetical protein